MAMREIWRASDPESVGRGATRHWRSALVPSTMTAWWVFYLLSGFAATGIALSNIDLTGQRAAVETSPATFVAHALEGVAGLLIITIMRQLARRQEAAAERLASGSAGTPGPSAYDPSASYGPQATDANPYSAPNPYT
jgi:hypothetical protein